ncbi:MAG: MATE family efflux transporter [Candidatus Woesearchaeota archaeon]
MKRPTARKNMVGDFVKDPKKALWKLSIPIMIGMFVQTLYNVVDTAYVGRLGTDSIAALTFAFPLFFIILAVNGGISAGMISRISRCLGAKQKRAAENTAVHGVLLSLVVALVVVVLGQIFLEDIFALFGASGAVIPLSISYMSIVLWGVFLMVPSFVITSIFSAQGDTKTPMMIQVSSLVLNIILDPIFIYALDMGVKGAAIATVISFGLSVVLGIVFLRTRSYLELDFRSFRYKGVIVKDIFRVGVPASLMMLLVSFYIIFINRLMAIFGTEYVAGYGLVARWDSLAILPSIAISMATLTLVGMFFGAKHNDLLKQTVFYAIKVGTGIAVVVGLLFMIFPHLFISVFTSDPVLLGIASPYLVLNAFALLLFPVIMIISRAMQGLGLGFPGLALNLLRICISLSLAYFFILGLGKWYLSVPIAMVIGRIIAGTAAVVWFSSKVRKLNGVEHAVQQ